MNPSNFGAKLCDSPSNRAVQKAVEAIRARVGRVDVSICLILGSGMGALADRVHSARVIPYREIPGFPLSHVAGHAGNLVLGSIAGVPVAALAGRAHLYEGWSAWQSTFPLRVVHALGAQGLLVSNASGGINPRFASGQVVLIDQHIDGMRRSPFLFNDASSTEHPAADQTDGNATTDTIRNTGLHRRASVGLRTSETGRAAGVYDEEWMEMASRHAVRLGFSLSRGTYLATLGPSYETRAEYRAFARMGADMVGMSTVPEVLLASHLGMRTLAFSIVTNVAKPDAPTKTYHAEVLDWSRQAQQQLIPLVESLLPECISNLGTGRRTASKAS